MIRLVTLVSDRFGMAMPASRSRTAAAWVPRAPVEVARKRDIGRKLMPDSESVRLVRRAVEKDTRAPKSPQVSLARKAILGSISSEMEL